MASTIWSGSISFGLVSVPVKLFSAVQAKTVRFHQLHKSDHARIEQKRVSSATGKEVAYTDIVKGYELAPERYVVIEPEELASLGAAGTRTIEIEDFVDLADIDPIFYDHAYYLAPATEAAEKPYHLLLDAMRDCEKVAVAKVVLRSKEHLVAIRPMGRVLGMATMNFADEIVSAEQLPGISAEDPELSKREREMARALVSSLASKFDPSKYHDSYREAVLDLIERKADGQEIAVEPSAPRQSAVPDLMAALKASLEDAEKRTGARKKPKPRKKTTTPAPVAKAAAAPKQARRKTAAKVR
jgi:DNA end-binding protein Ku